MAKKMNITVIVFHGNGTTNWILKFFLLSQAGYSTPDVEKMLDLSRVKLV